MKIVAILQNVWVRDPARVARSIARFGREPVLARLLFMGGKTGRILQKAFGEDICNEIVWEEASKEIGGKANAVYPADLAHLRELIGRHNPAVVLTFGKIAGDGVKQLRLPHTLIELPHPCARQPGTFQKILKGARELELLSLL